MFCRRRPGHLTESGEEPHSSFNWLGNNAQPGIEHNSVFAQTTHAARCDCCCRWVRHQGCATAKLGFLPLPWLRVFLFPDSFPKVLQWHLISFLTWLTSFYPFFVYFSTLTHNTFILPSILWYLFFFFHLSPHLPPFLHFFLALPTSLRTCSGASCLSCKVLLPHSELINLHRCSAQRVGSTAAQWGQSVKDGWL